MNINISVQHGIRLRPVAYEEVTVAATAAALSSGLANNMFLCIVRFEDGPLRCRVDGAAATSTVGWPAYDLDQSVFNQAEAQNFSAWRGGTTNGLLRITYYQIG